MYHLLNMLRMMQWRTYCHWEFVRIRPHAGSVPIACHFENVYDQEMDTCRTQIAELAEGVRASLPAEPYPMRIMQAISRHLFQEQGFRGNRSVRRPLKRPFISFHRTRPA